MDSYYKIKEVRQNLIAPVDVMGCYSVPSTVVDTKLYVLISLILSAQTKDEVTYQTMLNLCLFLNTKESNVRFTPLKVSYKIFSNILYLKINSKIFRYEKKDGKILGPEIELQENRLTLENLVNETNLKQLITPAGCYNKKYETIKSLVHFVLKNGYPSSLSECLSIKGIGRKISILYLNKFYRLEGISVDTHVHRICNLLCICKTKTPDETSKILETIIDMKEWSEFNSVLVGYGQVLCKPRGPKCTECIVKDNCSNFK